MAGAAGGACAWGTKSGAQPGAVAGAGPPNPSPGWTHPGIAAVPLWKTHLKPGQDQAGKNPGLSAPRPLSISILIRTPGSSPLEGAAAAAAAFLRAARGERRP